MEDDGPGHSLGGGATAYMDWGHSKDIDAAQAVSFEISAHVNRAVIAVDQDGTTADGDVVHVDASSSETRFRFTASEDLEDGLLELGDVNRSPRAIRYTTPAIGKFDFSSMIGVDEHEGDRAEAAVGIGFAGSEAQHSVPIGNEPTDVRMIFGSTVQNNGEHASVAVGYHYGTGDIGNALGGGDSTTVERLYSHDTSAGDWKLPPFPVPVPPPLPRL